MTRRIALQAAFDQRNADTNEQLFTAQYQYQHQVKTLVEQAQKCHWLGDLLRWIGEHGPDNISPCLIASKAAGMQEAWNKEQDPANAA